MHTSSWSRQHRPLSTQNVLASTTNTPLAKSSALPHISQPSPATSYSQSVSTTLSQQHKPNIVTRVAIEGKAKHDHDGATLKMYLKVRSTHDISIPELNCRAPDWPTAGEYRAQCSNSAVPWLASVCNVTVPYLLACRG